MRVNRRSILVGGSGLALAGVPAALWLRRQRIAVAMPAAPRPSSGGMCASAAPIGQAARPAALRPLHEERLARFVDRLPIPTTRKPDGLRPDPDAPETSLPYYRVSMRAAPVKVHRDVPPTPMWTYDGTVPGPTFETRSGQPLLVEWANDLPERHFLPIDHTLHGAGHDVPDVRTVVHVHGARVPPEADGHPEAWFPPGRSAAVRYPSRQDAATLWYHDHAMGIERLNQYAGLFGLLLVRDDVEASLGLPAGEQEVPLVLCDRSFSEDGQLAYPTSDDADSPWVPEVYGDVHLVNGKAFPYLDVEPRPYRFRVVNASNARTYDLSLSTGAPFHLIGTDQGLLGAPATSSIVTLAPAERADLVVDLGDMAGKQVILQSRTLQLLQLRVAAGPKRAALHLPPRLRPLPAAAPPPGTKTRTLTLSQYTDPRTRRTLMLLDGKYWHDPVTEKPLLGSTEIWELVNPTEDTHPIHLHLVRFRVLDRQLFDADQFLTSGSMQRVGAPIPPPPDEAGWKDTVRAAPGSITRIAVSFDGYPGRYVWHCHVLEHAANEMMRPFEVVGG
jgi:spore coat protein A